MSWINAAESGLYALVPNPISASAYYISPMAEPDPTKVMPDGTVGEVEWVSHPTNVLPVNARRIRVSTHRVYRDTAGGISTVPPENDPVRWFDEGPTNRWAWTDSLASTATTAASPASFTIDPGAANELELFGLTNVDTVRVRVYDAPGGTLLTDQTLTTEEYTSSDPHWELYFRGPAQGRTLSFTGLPIAPASRVIVTFSSHNGAPMGIGLMAFGVYSYLGLAQFGFSTVYRNYSYEQIDRWGNEVYVKGKKSKDLRGEAWLDIADARGVDRAVERLLDVGAIYRASTAALYTWLKTWGRLQPATITAAGPSHAVVSIDVRGNI
jgi:hypothetical protein